MCSSNNHSSFIVFNLNLNRTLSLREVEVVQLEALRDKFVDSLSEAFSSDEEEFETHSKAQRRESDVADEPGASGSWCSIS